MKAKSSQKNSGFICIFIAFMLCANHVVAQQHDHIPEWVKPVAAWPEVRTEVAQSISKILADRSVQKAMRDLKDDDAFTLKQTITLTEIPAPPFKEEEKAKAFLEMMKNAGLTNAFIDQEGNVIGIRKGAGDGPTVVVDAHLDTVFPLGTDLKVKVIDGVYHAPGITDDTRGLAVMLSWIRALEANKIETVGNLMFVGSVGEEGNGDLRGVKALFKTYKNIDAFIGMESIPMGFIVPLNTGSLRYEVKFTGKGGHSYGDFGEVPSALHAMGRAIAEIADIKPTTIPRTTYNIGIVKGGRSVNTISPDATMEIDIRSDSAEELKKLNEKILAILQKATETENKNIGQNPLTVTINKIGDRPSGMTPAQSPLIQSALASLRAMGQKEQMLIGSSTNAGIPISLNIPTIIIPPGGKFEGFHALTEAMDPTDGYKGAQIGLLTTLSAVGVAGVSQPILMLK